jgi:glycosyltransferase involved in cell wall biosynthesis
VKLPQQYAHLLRTFDMKTTVIIPVYNRPDTLILAVRSLIQQCDDVDLDVLIVDDGSTDQTSEVIADLVRLHPVVRTVSRENGGVTKARNTGLDNLLNTTDIVTFLDSDDLMAPGRFVADLPILKADPEIEVTYGNMVAVDVFDPETLLPAKGAVQKEITSIHLSCGLFRRSLINRIGHFDEALLQAEDTDYLLRIFETGTRFVQTTTICHYYLRHAGNMTKNLAEAKSCFALAVMKSMRRRKSDPTLQLNKPSFNIILPRELM